MDSIARMALAAARTPGTAWVRGDDAAGRPGRPGRAWLLAGATELVRVPADDVARGLEAFAAGLDALRGGRRGDAPVAAGWLSYDAARGAADPRPPGDRAPSAYLARYDHALTVDTATGAARGDTGPLRALVEGAGDDLPRGALGFGAPDRDDHARAVEAVRAAIRAGRVYLVNVARVLHAPPCADRGVLAARVLDAGARYGCVLNAGDVVVAGMSMELALAWDRTTDVAETRPIKGTRPRRADPGEDRREAEALAADPKERAENAMAVDVHRNDLGRVAAVGTVTVPTLCAVEPHRFVHHLVSTVRARIPPGVSARAVLGAMLPVGSVTGAPKRAAMETIARVEPERRGLYTGVYGVAFGDGSVQLAVAIRTLVADAAGVHYGVGGGVVWDSVPAREWEELEWKLRAAQGG